VIWTIRIPHQQIIILKVTDVFLSNFLPRTHDAEVRRLDPYRDAMLDQRSLTRWQGELNHVKVQMREETRARLAQTRRLPSDPTSREAVLRDWVERELSADEHFRTLLEVDTAVTLALDGGGIIEVMGD
jgi:hypothetical protein